MNISQLILQSSLPIREVTPSEVQLIRKIYLDILKDILYICKKHNLAPMLGGGSCLGAIRHNGFIPWDDDLDLIMLRKEYDILPELISKEFGEKYQCVGANVSNTPQYPYMKIQRTDCFMQTIYQSENSYDYLGIDLFPIDNIPNCSIQRLWHGFWLNFIQYLALCIHFYRERECYATKLLRSTAEGRKIVNFRLLIGKITSIFLKEGNLYEFFDRFAAKYQDKETHRLGIPTGREHYFGEIHPRTVFTHMTEVDFEGMKAPIPQDYDTYLSVLYGNYMEIPPVDKRERHYIVKIKLPTT